MIIVVLAVILLFLFLTYWHYLKPIRNVGNLSLITGGVKTGKSQLAVAIVFIKYRWQLIKYHFQRFFNLFRKNKRYLEKPLIYSNVPIGRAGKDVYVPLTHDLIERKERFRFGSVAYICEVSVVNGSKDIYNEPLNDDLNFLYKLCAHELHGGFIVLDTQSPMDCHYAVKRSLSTYYHIYRRRDFFFKTFSLLYVREKELIDGDHSQAIENFDPDDYKHDGKKVLYVIPMLNRKWWRRYDRYAYSSLTDDLPVNDHVVKVTKNKKAGKAEDLIRAKNIIKKEVKKNEKTKQDIK